MRGTLNPEAIGGPGEMEDAAVTEGGDRCQLEGLQETGDSQGGAEGTGLDMKLSPRRAKVAGMSEM